MKDFLNYAKNRILYNFFRILIIVIICFLIGIIKAKAAIVQSNRGFYYMTNSSGSFIQQNYINGNNSLTLPNNSRISAWWLDFNSESFSLIPGQTYTAYLYFNINNTSYAWVENGTNLYFGVNCVDAPDNTSTCTNYLKTYTNASIVSNMILIEFDFIAPTLSEGDIVYIALNNSTSNNYALAYSSGNSVSISFNKLSYDLSSGGITSGEQIIIDGQNKMSEEQKKTNKKLDEAENTRKGIWDTIKDLPNQFLNMLKGLFIPEDGYFQNWFNELKLFFEEKLGFLATPITLFIDFVNMYLDLNSSEDIIINIPDITVPNFDEHKIISATSFNWSQTLKSKDSLNTLWQLYLSFIDVFLILNFLNLCENKYNKIFGGDTSNYEYYTVEDSYTYDNNTGEVLSSRRNERKTTRKKVE